MDWIQIGNIAVGAALSLCVAGVVGHHAEKRERRRELRQMRRETYVRVVAGVGRHTITGAITDRDLAGLADVMAQVQLCASPAIQDLFLEFVEPLPTGRPNRIEANALVERIVSLARAELESLD